MRAALVTILIAAAVPRFYELGRESFWYDEVIPIRLAREPNPAALIRLMDQIEATRAPLQPLILMGWIRMFGPSEASARSFAALCGVLTVAVVFAIGRQLGGEREGLWAAGLAAMSPLLVEYSREVKMYSFLTLLTCVTWWQFFLFRRSATAARGIAFAALVASLMYTHPLGLFMAAALALAAMADLGRSRLGIRGWMAVFAAAAGLFSPWLRRYLDHDPEFVTGPLGIKFLLGMPIGFTGGGRWTLLDFAALILLGLLPLRIRGLTRPPPPLNAWPVVAWLAVPPVLLYAYSAIGHPIFGPSRYNVYVAPAYCLLVGRGLARLRRGPTILAVVVLAQFLVGNVRDWLLERPPNSDWREAARWLDENAPGAPVVVTPPDSSSVRPNFEVVVARYYLGEAHPVGTILEDGPPRAGEGREIIHYPEGGGPVFLSRPSRGGFPMKWPPSEFVRDFRPRKMRTNRWHDFRGLDLNELRKRPEP